MSISKLLGKTLTKVYTNSVDELHFITDKNKHYMLYHEQDCCEDVYLEDVAGDLEDLVGSPILRAEKRSNNTAT